MYISVSYVPFFLTVILSLLMSLVVIANKRIKEIMLTEINNFTNRLQLLLNTTYTSIVANETIRF